MGKSRRDSNSKKGSAKDGKNVKKDKDEKRKSRGGGKRDKKRDKSSSSSNSSSSLDDAEYQLAHAIAATFGLWLVCVIS